MPLQAYPGDSFWKYLLLRNDSMLCAGFRAVLPQGAGLKYGAEIAVSVPVSA
jgi:hypothetical protein